MPLTLVLASHGAKGIKWHHCIHYRRTIKMRWNVTFGHLMPLALASVSHDTSSIINGSTAFLRLRELNKVQHLFGNVMPLSSDDAIGIVVSVMWCHCIGVSIMWCIQHHWWYHCTPSRSQDDQRKCNMPFSSGDDIGNSISSMWCQWHQQWHHSICSVKIIKMRCNMTFWSCEAFWHCVMFMTLSMAQQHFLAHYIQNKMQNDFLVMLYHWLQHWLHANSVVSGIIAFPRSSQLK